MTWRPWRQAMREALYGPMGFYRAPGLPHYRTSAHNPVFASAVHLLAERTAAALGTGSIDVVDMGAGDGRLLRALAATAPQGWRLAGVDVTERPADLPERVAWHVGSDALPGVAGLVLANEWLDNVPVDVVEGGRVVLVDDAGAERPGPPAERSDAEWLSRWWPGPHGEVGRDRDEAWAGLIARLESGVAVAIDYPADPRRHSDGTLTGYQDGRQVRPVPDGTCDVTAHVVLAACAEAGERAGATATLLTTQGAALRALGIEATRPPLDLAEQDPRGYLTLLQRAGDAAELVANGGLGDFGWLVQAVSVDVATIIPDPAPDPGRLDGGHPCP